ncbi:hypothetical protein P3342_011681 [Pyrenophora teres f. teres]|nr:hypothetical protein P3342_011681 [Pyrenophora teres f. teres]
MQGHPQPSATSSIATTSFRPSNTNYYLVKLGTIYEKRLMIGIMALRQSYERREIAEIRWINGEDNPANALTKATPNRALERVININMLSTRLEGCVQRPAR